MNQGKIFSIVVSNLLYRDQNFTAISAAERLAFLRVFAAYLQSKKGDVFADPSEVWKIIRELFGDDARRSDHPEQVLENYYRTCRRHSGLTTEGQFLDTSGQIDMPVDETDKESRVGFSHNSLREFLVADAFCDYVKNGRDVGYLSQVTVTEAIADFFWDIMEYETNTHQLVERKYSTVTDSNLREKIFHLIHRRMQSTKSSVGEFLGMPPRIIGLDISGFDFSGLKLENLHVDDCIAQDTDFRGSILTNAAFDRSILDRVMFDGCRLNGADFRGSQIDSIYVFDEFDTRTSAVFMGKDARQWLFSNGAKVHPASDLNPYLGQPWYEAAREVTRTLERRIAATFQETSLAKGTKKKYREFAKGFVEHLKSKGILEPIFKSKHSKGSVVRVRKDMRGVVTDFSQKGIIHDDLMDYFQEFLKLNSDA